MKKYYIPYDESANINYSFLFSLYMIAERNKEEKLDNIIEYKTQKELADKIKSICNYIISVPTISRTIQNKIYIPYFSKSEKENKLILNNNFKSGKAKSNKFVTLNEKELLFLLEQNNNQLTKYYLYLKYYCGRAETHKIDSTANQILSAIGYSANCGNNKGNLCAYNYLLEKNGFIKIDKKIGKNGHCRNIYSMSL